MSPLINGVADKHLADTKFSDLSDKQKGKLIENYGSKADARDAWKGARTEYSSQNTPAPSPTPTETKVAPQLVGTKYRDMSPAYQERVSRPEYKERREEQRMAGEHIGIEGQNKDTYRAEVLDIDELDDYNRRAIGAGGSTGGKTAKYDDGGTPDDVSDDKFGKGVDRLSKIDLKLLLDSNANWLGQSDLVEGDEGYLPDDLRAKQELIDYSKRAVDDGSRQGSAARRLLGKWIDDIANYEYIPPEDPTDPPPSDPPPTDPPPTDPPPTNPPPTNPPPTTGGPGDDPVITVPGDENVVVTDPMIGDIVTGDENLINDGTIITNPGAGSQIGVVDIDNEVIQDLDQDATATINMGDVTLTTNGNTLTGGSQINIDASQNAGDAIATNTGTQTSTITNDVTQVQRQYNPYTGSYELQLGGGSLANSLRDQIFAAYGA